MKKSVLILLITLFVHISYARDKADTLESFPDSSLSESPVDSIDFNSISRLINSDSLEKAVNLSLQKQKKYPDNPELDFLTGKAFFRMTEYDSSVKYLNNAVSNGYDHHSETINLLGLSYGRNGNYIKAASVLGIFESISDDEKRIRQVNAQCSFYEDKLFKEMAKEAIESEKKLDSVKIDKNTVAVLHFKNVDNSGSCASLQKGLADMIITDLSQVGSLNMIERTRMNSLLNEIALDQAGLTQKERLRTAKLLKAGRIVGGMFKCPDDSAFMIKGGFSDVEKSETHTAAGLSGKLENFFDIEKKFVFAILDKMGIKITDDERQEIQKIPTENLLAFMAYSEGLDAYDRGDYQAAQQAFSKAAGMDPSFKSAVQKRETAAQAQKLSASTETKKDVTSPEITGEPETESEPELDIPIASPQPETESSEEERHSGFRASSSTSLRSASIAGGGFMNEVTVGNTTENSIEPEIQQTLTDPPVDNQSKGGYTESDDLEYILQEGY